jgi:hypothetical protein
MIMKSLQNFGFILTNSKLGHFKLDNDKSWKSQFRSYLVISVAIDSNENELNMF